MIPFELDSSEYWQDFECTLYTWLGRGTAIARPMLCVIDDNEDSGAQWRLASQQSEERTRSQNLAGAENE